MGYYRDNLKKFNEADLKIWEILCAAEVNTRLPDLSDEQFENLVDFVYDWAMNSEMMPAELLGYIATGLADKEFTLDDFGSPLRSQNIVEIINKKI